jgi:mRNA interferase MazF
VAIAPTAENGCSKLCWAVSHLVATTAKTRLRATSFRVTKDQLGRIRRQIVLAVGIEG